MSQDSNRAGTGARGKISPAEIGFDIDGVVADTAGAFLRIAREDYGINHFTQDDITAFEVENCLDLDPEIVTAIFHRLLVEPLTTGLQPMPGAVKVLSEMATAAPLTLITARPYLDPIMDWLSAFLDRKTLNNSRVIAMGDHDGKVRHIKQYGLRYFVDDRAETCLMLQAEGLSPVVYSQPWNKGRHNLPMVENWQEIRALCFD